MHKIIRSTNPFPIVGGRGDFYHARMHSLTALLRCLTKEQGYLLLDNKLRCSKHAAGSCSRVRPVSSCIRVQSPCEKG